MVIILRYYLFLHVEAMTHVPGLPSNSVKQCGMMYPNPKGQWNEMECSCKKFHNSIKKLSLRLEIDFLTPQFFCNHAVHLINFV